MTESKKVWVEPELIVLVRSNPEEMVLQVCKTREIVGSGVFFHDLCHNLDCWACNAVSQS
jgi:hypothetical protein